MRALIVVLVALVGLAVVLDRVGVSIAENRVAERIADEAGLAAPPAVDIRGFPVLPQAIAGRYDEVRIELSADQLGQPQGTAAEVVLQGVEVPLSDLLTESVVEVPVERIDGTATLAYDLISRELGPETELLRDGDRLRINRTVEVLGRAVPLTAAGDLTLEGNDLVVDVQEASGAGVGVPGFLVERATDMMDVRYTVPPLPFGLELTAVTPARDGVIVAVQATGAVIGG